METTYLTGKRLVESNIITQEELEKGLERQRRQGGKLGYNLMALGFITEEEIEAFFNPVPLQPKTVKETGLNEVFINELILKHAVDMTEFTIQQMSRSMGLPPVILDPCVSKLRRDRFLEVKGGADLSKMSYRYTLSDAGRKKGSQLKEICRYT
ncbi:MAG: ATPase, partial [Desulfobacteraceae bacterium]|nr:ATPase [Desulfobacteraceae bacterium]